VKTQTEPLRGTVVDELGAPVANVEVSDLWLSTQSPQLIARTDKNGAFVLNRPASMRVFGLIAKDRAGGRQGYLGSSPEDLSFPPPMRIVLRKPREIVATVVDAKGQPVPSAIVAVNLENINIDVDKQLTDASGKAVLRVPADVPLGCVFVVKDAVGVDYFVFRKRGEAASDPYTLAADGARPLQFVLAGARTLRVRIVDEQQKPQAGVVVYGYNFRRKRKGGSLGLNLMKEFIQTTDAAGVATFRTIPSDATEPIHFGIYGGNPQVLGGNYNLRGDALRWNPASGSNEITGVLIQRQNQAVTIRGRVTFADGRPAAQAKVLVTADSRWMTETIECDANGAFETRLLPDCYCALTAVKRPWAAPAVVRAIRSGTPVEPFHLVLQPAVRVHGAMTYGKARRPLPNRDVFLQQLMSDLYDSLPADQRLSDYQKGPGYTWSGIRQDSRTDAHGGFEFFACTGRYLVYGPERGFTTGPDGKGLPTITEIKTQKEIGVELHRERPDVVELSGRVVLKSEPQRGVPDVTVRGFRTSQGGPVSKGLSAVSGLDGKFHATCEPCERLVYASTDDHLLSGICQIGADDTAFVISVGPTASVHGRLLDELTGKPAIGREVGYGVKVTNGIQTLSWYIFGRTETDARGEFLLNGIVPGWSYELHAQTRLDAGRRMALATAGHFRPDNAAPIEFGTVRLVTLNVTPPGKKSKRMRRPIFDSNADADRQVAAALAMAKRDHKRVLLEFGGNWCGWCHLLGEAFLGNQEVAELLKKGFVFVAVESDTNPGLLEKYVKNKGLRAYPHLTVLDADGNVLMNQETDVFTDGPNFDPAKIKAFLAKWSPSN
jgi:thiol-disulfide isomerase/thioredoxin